MYLTTVRTVLANILSHLSCMVSVNLLSQWNRVPVVDLAGLFLFLFLAGANQYA